jgi:hypothetical protein
MPVDEFKLQRDVGRQAQAQALLDNPLLQEAFTLLETAYVKAWKETLARDDDGRERLWQAVQVVGKVRDHITNVFNTGKIAQRDLQELTTKRKLAERVFG